MVVKVSNISRASKEKTPRITGSQSENNHGDPIFLLQFFNVPYITSICAKFEKI